MPRVLIVEDGTGPHPLAAVRSFGRAGWHVGIGSPFPGGRAASSRWVRNWYPVPPVERDVEDFLAATRSAIEEGGYDLVFGGDDVEVLALSAARDLLGAQFPYPKHASVLRAIDKESLTRAAVSVGLACPRTVAAEYAAELGWPVVVKARMHWTPGQRNVPARLDRAMCHTQEQVDDAVARIAAAGGAALVQEVVRGDLMALTMLLDRDGLPVATVQQRARRISPEWHNSVRAETVPVEAELAEGVRRMLVELGWWGLANLQFLRPPDDGAVPRLIDFNGRFYGSLALARAAGADLPVCWAALSLGAGRPGGAPLLGRPGVRYQALDEDLRRAAAERRHGLVRDVLETLAYAPGAVHSTWAADDPRPGLRRGRALLRSWAGSAVRRALRAATRRTRTRDA